MKSIIKKASLFFIIMVAMLMMSMTYAVEDCLFAINDIPSSVTIHVNTSYHLPLPNPENWEENYWQIISGEKYLNTGGFPGREEDGKTYYEQGIHTKKVGKARIAITTNDGIEHIVTLKIVNHKYDKTTNTCTCGAKRPATTFKFSSSSYTLEVDKTGLEISKYLTVKPTNAITEISWYTNAISSWYDSGKIYLSNDGIYADQPGIYKVKGVDKVSGKTAETIVAVFSEELLSQYTVCLDEIVSLPFAEKGVEWKIVSGDNKIEEAYDGGRQFKGIKAGTAKLVYSTEAGEFKTTIKVSNHKFNKKTGVCSTCGAKQPPKKFEFKESTYVLTGGEYDLSSSKYLNLQPTNANVNLKWYVNTIKSWYG
ncbi:MAG: hypothetical protein J6B87_01370, partial [Clostridia bacterium]|nr:hypothetical protein [Clostridia bacterium]